MIIRKAEEKDIPRILELLGQVLQIHADIRPDIFIPNTTKYTYIRDSLNKLIKQHNLLQIVFHSFRRTSDCHECEFLYGGYYQ